MRFPQDSLYCYKRKKPKWRRKIKFFNCKGCSFLTVWSNALKKPVKHNCPNRSIILLFTTKNIKLQPSTPGCIRVYQAATKYIEVQSSTSMLQVFFKIFYFDVYWWNYCALMNKTIMNILLMPLNAAGCLRCLSILKMTLDAAGCL